MKVSELKKGMLVKPAGDQEWFASFPLLLTESRNDDPSWIHVRIKPRQQYANWRITFKESRTAVYLGTKKDLGLNCKWTNRFLFIDGEIFGVDPHAWRRISPVI